MSDLALFQGCNLPCGLGLLMYSAAGNLFPGLISVWDPSLTSGFKMPIIFEKNGFRFFFYSNEHNPVHVHVRYAGGEAVFEIDTSVVLREAQNMKVSDLARAQRLAEKHKQLILEKWNEHLA